MICPKCFNLLDDDAKTCPFCNSSLQNTVTSIIDESPEFINEFYGDDTTSPKATNMQIETHPDILSDDVKFAVHNNEIRSNIPPQQSRKNSQEKILAIIAYFGWLCLVPLLAGKTEFSKTHGKRGLVILIINKIAKILLPALNNYNSIAEVPPTKIIFAMIFYVIQIALVVLCIMGLVYAITEKNKKLPIIDDIIGKFTNKNRNSK